MCRRHEAKLSQINIRRVVLFARINHLIERVHEYVMMTNPLLGEMSDVGLGQLPVRVVEMVREGTHCYDEFCCILKCGKAEVDRIFRSCRSVSIVYC